MANPFSVNVPSIDQGFASGESGYSAIRNLMQAREQDAARKDAQEALMSGDTRGAIARLIGANDPKLAAVLSEYHNSANGVFGTPIMLQQPDGSYKVGAIGRGGEGRLIDFGAGNAPTVPSKLVDSGTGTYVIPGRVAGAGAVPGAQSQPNATPPGQPAVGRPVPTQGYYPKDIEGKARETKYGTEIGDRQADLGKAKASLDSSLSNVDRMSDVARSIKGDPALASITGVPGVFPNWPGGRAANVQARLDNLTSQVGFAVLQAMRDASKTGGALGQVSDFENRQLQNNLSALQRAQSAEQFRSELDKLIKWGDGVKQRLQAAYDQDYSRIPNPNPLAQPTTQTTPITPTAKPSEMKVIGGKQYGKVGDQWFEF